jgi:hypothetical protein
VVVKITGSNDGPVLTGVAGVLSAGTEDTVYNFSEATLKAGYTDADHASFSVANLTATLAGGAVQAVVANGDGTYNITLPANYNGNISLAYSLTDGSDSVSVVKSIVVNPVEDEATNGCRWFNNHRLPVASEHRNPCCPRVGKHLRCHGCNSLHSG